MKWWFLISVATVASYLFIFIMYVWTSVYTGFVHIHVFSVSDQCIVTQIKFGPLPSTTNSRFGLNLCEWLYMHYIFLDFYDSFCVSSEELHCKSMRLTKFRRVKLKIYKPNKIWLKTNKECYQFDDDTL